MMFTRFVSFFLFIFFVTGCNSQPVVNVGENRIVNRSGDLTNITQYDTTYKTIHVFVALCDNKYQGIVPVPAKIGNGQDLNNNLYWGCAFGVRTFFKNSKEWRLVQVRRPDSILMERLIFKHTEKKYFLIADAYNGQFIKDCTREFFYSSSGQLKDTLQIDNTSVGIYGNSNLVSYIGHDGLMDFDLDESFENADGKNRDCIILACISKNYFAKHLTDTKAYPLVWTTGLMCPEAYTLHDALSAYVNNESKENIRNKAVSAYSKYQKCSDKAARSLLVSGW